MENSTEQKIQTYFEKKTFVCIFLNDKFYHGHIQEINSKFIMFKDRFLTESFPIFFNEITKVEPSRQRVQ
jgi:hypothetical protein